MYSPTQPYNDLEPIPAHRLETPATLKAAISAGRSLAALKAAGPLIPNQVVLLRAMLLQEAQASSEIENIVTTNDVLYRSFDVDPGNTDPSTKEVLRYGLALWEGYDQLMKGIPIRPSMMMSLVSTLKGFGLGVRQHPGCKIASDRPGEVVYTPPEGKDRILTMLNDLCEFMAADDGIEPLIKMAAAHRQFEAIHPFSDGNGRTGRVLNVLYLVQSGLLDLPILYLSREILMNKSEYYLLLRSVTETQEWEPWILYMLNAVESTAKQTLATLHSVRDTIEKHTELARTQMRKGYSRELIELVFSQPYTRIQWLETAGIARRNAASTYLRELERIGVLTTIRVGRDRLFLNRHLLEALTGQENGTSA